MKDLQVLYKDLQHSVIRVKAVDQSDGSVCYNSYYIYIWSKNSQNVYVAACTRYV